MTSTDFIEQLGKLFEAYIDKKLDEATLINAIQYWFFSLPKYTKVTTTVYTGRGRFDKLDSGILKLKAALRKPEIDAKEFLFETVPDLFENTEYDILVDQITSAKKELDELLPRMLEGLKIDVCEEFGVASDVDWRQRLKDWSTSLPERTKRHCFDGGEDHLIAAINRNIRDIPHLCIILTGLAPDDFEETTPTLFVHKLAEHKTLIDSYGKGYQNNELNTYAIYLEGRPIRTFSKLENVSETGKLMLNEVTTVISEYGPAIGVNEKRQILLNVLEKIG